MNFGILLFEGVEELDFVGPWEMIAMWSAYADGPKNLFTVAEKKGIVTCAKGLEVIAKYDFDDCPNLDYLLVPGGFSVFDELDNQTIIDFIKQKAKQSKQVLSVCSGSFLLYKAGLLQNKNVTTHWKTVPQMMELPNLTVENQRFVNDGNIWTSAGVSAGIDMLLAFIESVAGVDAASTVQLNAEYYPSPKVYGDKHKTLPNTHYQNIK